MAGRAEGEAGFGNLSIDLIYAIPGLSSDGWRKAIETALSLSTPHLSAYTLTIEEKTTFGNWVRKGKLTPVDESTAAAQMETLVSMLTANGYSQYEISNFARLGFESVHNSNYWKGEKYLGIGPSAHSYNKTSRQHNVSNNHLYVRAIAENRLPAEHEVLRKSEQINEYILDTILENMLIPRKLRPILKHRRCIGSVDIVECHLVALIECPPNVLIRFVFVLFDGFGVF